MPSHTIKPPLPASAHSLRPSHRYLSLIAFINLSACWCLLPNHIILFDCFYLIFMCRYLSLIAFTNLVVGGSFAFSPTPPVAFPGGPLEAAGLHLYRTDFGLQIAFLLGVVNYVLVVRVGGVRGEWRGCTCTEPTLRCRSPSRWASLSTCSWCWTGAGAGVEGEGGAGQGEKPERGASVKTYPRLSTLPHTLRMRRSVAGWVLVPSATSTMGQLHHLRSSVDPHCECGIQQGSLRMYVMLRLLVTPSIDPFPARSTSSPPSCLLLLPRFAVVATILESGVDLSAPGSNLLPNVVSAGLIGASVSAVYLYQAVFASAEDK